MHHQQCATPCVTAPGPQAEQRKRERARDAAAPKAKPLWEEDGKRRGMLDKWVAHYYLLGL